MAELNRSDPYTVKQMKNYISILEEKKTKTKVGSNMRSEIEIEIAVETKLLKALKDERPA